MAMTTLSAIMCPTAIQAQPTPPLQGNWTLTFEENFDGTAQDNTALDGTKWRVGQHYAGIAGNGGTSPEQIKTDDGVLSITAKQAPTSFSGVSYNYASGEVSTFKTFRQQYGYYECRMKYDAVSGMWPAFWLMPDRGTYGWLEGYRQAYLKFDLTGVNLSQVTSAELRLTISSANTGSNNNVLVMKLQDDSWTESTLTWNNKPAPDPAWIKQYYNQTYTTNQQLNTDVTAYVAEQMAGDKTVSFVLADTFERNLLVQFHSSEAATPAYRPQLVINGVAYEATEDSHVRQGTLANTNYGTLSVLQVQDSYQDASSTYGDGNEIDIMETLGIWGPDRTQHAVHWDGYGSSHQSVEHRHAFPSEGDDFHTYGLYWESGKYEFYVDGVLTYEWANAEVMACPAYVILSLQLGGWDNNNVGPQVDGRSVEVDYVRVWSGTKTGPTTPGGGEGPAPTYTVADVTEDTYVRSGTFANTNYGADVALAVKRQDSSDYTRRTFLKFDVSGLDPDAERIELVLTPASAPSPRDTRIYAYLVDDDTWSAGSLTWNNQPANGTLGNARMYLSTDQDFILDVTSIAKTEISRDGVLSLMLTAANDAAYSSFHSMESASPAPYLRAAPQVAGGTQNPDIVVLDPAGMTSYSTQDVAGGGVVSPDGSSLTLSGNTWKKLPLNYTVTTDTMLAFTVDASDVGEIIGLGLEENNNHEDVQRIIQVGGSQLWSMGHHVGSANAYVAGSGPITYEIPLGLYYTGAMFYLAFVADDDADASASVTFSDIQIYEGTGSPGGALTLLLEAESASAQPAFSPFQVVNGHIVVPNGTGNANSNSVTEQDGLASYTFVLSQAADVAVDVHGSFPNGADDSYWYRMDSGAFKQQNNSTASVHTHTFTGLAAGSHTFTIARREDGAAIDYLLIIPAAGTISQ